MIQNITKNNIDMINCYLFFNKIAEFLQMQNKINQNKINPFLFFIALFIDKQKNKSYSQFQIQVNSKYQFKKMEKSEQKVSEFSTKQYKTFLDEVTHQILKACIEDDALSTLKKMQSQQYLIERINQITTSVYQLQKENTVQKLAKQLETYRQIIEENVQKFNQNQNQKENTSYNNMAQKYKQKQNEKESVCLKILQNQNIQFQKQLILQEQEHKFHIRELNETITFLTVQNQSIKKNSSDKLSGMIQNFMTLQEKFRNTYQQKTIIEQNLQTQIEKSIKQNIKLKDAQQQNSNLIIKNQKLAKQLNILQQKDSLLNEKLIRLEQTIQRSQNQIKNYQNQIKLIKMVQSQTKNQQKKQYQLSLDDQIKKIKQLEQEEIQYSISQKDKKIFELEKLKQKLKSQKNNIQMQFHDYRMKSQRQKSQMETNIKNISLKGQKTIRILKQEYLKQKQQYFQQFQVKITTQKNRIQTKFSKQIQQHSKNQDLFKKRQQQNKKHLKQMQLLLKQKQQVYFSSLNQYQQKNNNMKSYIKEMESQINNKNINQNQIQKQNSLKDQLHEDELKFIQSQNAKLKKQLQKLKEQFQKIQTKSLSLLAYSPKKGDNDKDDILNRQYQKCIKQLKQNQIILESQLKYLKKQLKQRVDQLNQQKIINQEAKQKFLKYEQKCQKIDKQLTKQKKQIFESQTNHQAQIQQIKRKYQTVNSQSKRQITYHYEQLLKDQQKKIQEITNNDTKVETKIVIKTLKETIQDLRTSVQKYEQKILFLNSSKVQLNQQLKKQAQKIQQLKNIIKEQENKLKVEKQKQKQLISYYQSKLHINKIKFKDFKYEFYVALKQALDELKKELYNITLNMKQMQNEYQNYIEKISMQIFKQVSHMKVKHSQQIKAQKQYYQNQVILKLQIDKQEISYQNQKKNKQKNIQIMTILAQKQYQLAHLAQKDKHNSRKINQLYQNLTLTQQQLQKTKKQNISFKQVLQKMNDKVCHLEKQKITQSHELKSITQQKISLQKQLTQLQSTYMQKLQKCRQKYIKQNQKLFNKYQRQFDKLIGMNSKNKQLGMGMSSISSILSPYIIPTKQCQKVGKDKKLQNLAKQIQMQKKKLQLLEGTKLKNNKSKEKDCGVTNLKRTCPKLKN